MTTGRTPRADPIDPGPMSRERWATEALKALARGGLSELSVEPMARRLGVTKGSFYWHFKNRDALLQAALERLEQNNAEAIEDFERRFPEPRARLRALFSAAFEPSSLGSLLIHLSAQREHPVIGPALERVTASRLRYLERIFQEIGLEGPAAQRQAFLSYSAYVGHYQVALTAPDHAPRGESFQAYISHLVEALVP